VRDTPGTVDVRNDADLAQPEVRAILDRKRMADLGVTASQVGAALRAAIGGTSTTNQFQRSGQTGIDITVIADRDIRNDVTALANVPIPLGNTGSTTSSVGQPAAARAPKSSSP
jgi:multidrug efflux pump subunit AcrB